MSMNIYVLHGTPTADADTTKRWEDVYAYSRTFAFLTIDHHTLRDTSRWQSVARKRCFQVQKHWRGRMGLCSRTIGWYPTLSAALEAADRYAKA